LILILVVLDSFAKSRHPGESRGPEIVKHAGYNWIPAFAGMTNKLYAASTPYQFVLSFRKIHLLKKQLFESGSAGKRNNPDQLRQPVDIGRPLP
jgi:hypothetical protein